VLIVVKKTRSQEVSVDAIVEFLEPPSVTLMNDKPAGLHRRTYKGTRVYNGDDEIVASEESTLTNKMFKRNFQQN
jgi:hypothetical protein